MSALGNVDRVAEWVHMGGYGLYVWGSVLVVLGLLLAEVLQLAWQRRSLLRALKASA